MFEFDQAAGLRQLFLRQRPSVVIACGDDTVQAGVTIGLASEARQSGLRVLMIDGSAGEVPRLLGMSARYELGHVIAGDKSLSDVILKHADGLRVLPAMRGLEQLPCLNAQEADRVRHQFALQRSPVDLLIVNPRPFGAITALDAFQGQARNLVIASDRAASITAAYGEIKALKYAWNITECDVLINASSPRFAADVFDNLSAAAAKFLGVRLISRGDTAAGFGSMQWLSTPPSDLPGSNRKQARSRGDAYQLGHAANARGPSMKGVHHAASI